MVLVGVTPFRYCNQPLRKEKKEKKEKEKRKRKKKKKKKRKEKKRKDASIFEQALAKTLLIMIEKCPW